MNLWKWQNVGSWLSRQNLTGRTLARRKGRGFSKLPAEVLESRALLSTLTVTTLNDTVANDGQVSLREALNTANSDTAPDTIVFANSLAGGTISLSGGQLGITNDVTIQGDCNITIDAQGDSRIFNITGATTDVTLDGLKLLNGSVNAAGGGAINAAGATLTVSDTTISGSVANGGSGGAILATAGDVTVLGSTLSQNSTVGANANGGAIAFNSPGTLRLINATVSGNFTTDVSANGGGVSVGDGTLISTNSTIAFNDAGGTAGGVYATLADAVTIANTIISNNTDALGDPDLTALNANVFNSIVGIDAGPNLTLSGTSSGNFIGTTGTPVDPLLAPLADNGGCVQTHALLPGSIAIDMGNIALSQDALGATLTTDARGDCFLRTDVGNAVDIGAFEVQAGIVLPPVNIVPSALQVIENTPVTLSAALGTQLAVYDPSAAGKPIQVTLNMTGGMLDLSQTTGLTFSGPGDGTADTTVTFTGTVANINAALAGATFTPTASAPGTASIQMVTSDLGIGGTAQTDTDTVNISVVTAGTNLAPVITAPSAIHASSGTELVFSAASGQVISIADLDASNPLTVTLTATHGTLTLGPDADLGIVSGGSNGSTSLELTGTVAEINAALAGLKFKSNNSFTGPASITVNVEDNDGLTDTQTIAVTVDTHNVAPTVTLPTIDSITSGTNLVLGLDLTGAWTTNNGSSNHVTSIVQSGNQLVITNRKGQSFLGSLSTENGVITITQYGQIDGPVNKLHDVSTTATVSADGKSISWTGVPHVWSRTTVPTTNNIVIGDGTSGSSIVLVDLELTNATLTLSQTDGLTLLNGTDGTDDTSLRIMGTVDDINAALRGAILTPTGEGEACLVVNVNDMALSGALSTTQVFHLDVTPSLAGAWVNSHGRATEIVQVGDLLFLIGGRGQVSSGVVDSDTQITVTSSGNGLQGRAVVSDDGSMISFAGGEVWTRSVMSSSILDDMFASN